MKFSIIIPIYKVEKYLCECIDSVLKQKFKDYEIILVDDGSPDRCPQICDEYARNNNNIRVIHQTNAGLACARNAGIKEAKGEYIICIDSDDYLADCEVLQKIADKAKKSVDMVLYGYRKLYESSQSYGEDVTPFLMEPCSVKDMLKAVLSTDTYCGTAWTKAVRLELIHENNILFRPGMISEDIDWYLHLLCYAKTCDSINETALIYRQRPGSISHGAKLNSLTDNLWILEYWSDCIKEIKIDDRTKDELMKVMAYYYANDLILYAGFPRKIATPYRNRFKAKSFILDYAATPRAIQVKKFYAALGFDMTILALKVLLKFKKRQ